ncbi:MAG: DNRLRE domain-containing protein, partial [Armatimonadota bacterium]
MSRAAIAAVVVGMAISSTLAPRAASLAAPDPSPAIHVIEDEAVVSSFPDFNLHASTTSGGLAVGTDSLNRPARSYLKFGLSAIPDGATVTQATLHVYLNFETWAADRDIGAYSAGDGWSETTITWNTAPATTGGPHDTIPASFEPPAWFSLDVTTPVAAEAAGDDVLTLVLREVVETGGGTWNYFAEKDFDTALAAHIHVQYDTGPAPAPPVADAGEDRAVEQTSWAGAEVTLDGSGSTHAATYEWHEGTDLLGTDP